MKIVVDANIIFSLAKTNSITSSLVKNSNLELITPNFVINEIEEHKSEIINKFKLNNWEEFINEIKKHIDIISEGEYSNYLNEARNYTKDIDDIAYFAVSIKYKCPIWSNDSEFKKQNKITVFNTKELIDILSISLKQ